MVCPKCQSESNAAFCPGCGLDLQIYQKVERLQYEVTELRALLTNLRLGSSENRVEQTSTKVDPRPPPLPPPLPAAPVPTPTMRDPVPAGPVNRPPSAELALGQRWFLGIGVFVLLLAIGFFLKYAFDQQWIRPPLQITAGVLLGVFLIAGGELCHRRQWIGLDIALAAVGLGALYLSVYAANQIYRMVPDGLTVLVVLLISAVGLLISSVWNSRILAGLSFLGGYLSPLIFHADELGNWVFFGYLSALNITTVALAYVKRWSLLSWLGAVLSWSAFQVWSSTHMTGEQWAFAFWFTQTAFLFYSLFPFLRLRHPALSWRLIGVAIALINGWLCAWKSAELLQYERLPVSLVALAYSAAALSLALAFWRRDSYSAAVTWLIAQGLVYLLVTWMMIVSDSWTSAFWAAQTVATYWIAAKAKDRVLLTGTTILGVVVAFRFLFVDISLLGFMPAGVRFFDGVFSRWLVALVVTSALFAVSWLAAHGSVRGAHPNLARWFEVIGLISLFGFCNEELERISWDWYFPITLAAFSILWTLFAATLLVIGLAWKRKFYRVSAIILLFITISKVLILDTAEVSTPYRILSCTVLGAILVALSFLYHRFATRLLAPRTSASSTTTKA
jgi:uncharacterized membrane protein